MLELRKDTLDKMRTYSQFHLLRQYGEYKHNNSVYKWHSVPRSFDSSSDIQLEDIEYASTHLYKHDYELEGYIVFTYNSVVVFFKNVKLTLDSYIYSCLPLLSNKYTSEMRRFIHIFDNNIHTQKITIVHPDSFIYSVQSKQFDLQSALLISSTFILFVGLYSFVRLYNQLTDQNS